MYFTYVLICKYKHSEKFEFYIGYTENLLNRIKVHNSRSVSTTKKFDFLKLVYFEASLNKTDARKREIQLKTGFGRGYLRKRLGEYLKTAMVVQR